MLVTCDDDNPASARVIEKNGGVLEGKIDKKDQKVPVRRYWIDLERQLHSCVDRDIPINQIVEIDRQNMAGFIEAQGGRFDSQRRLQSLKDEIKKGAVFIFARRANNLVGYIEYWLEDNILKIASIQIIPAFRNGTILRELLSKAYINMKENKPSIIISSAHVNNVLSIKLNTKLGLEKIREEKDRLYFQANGPEFLKRLADFNRYLQKDKRHGS